jgi:SAM-dependent methyltransferase
VQEYLPPAQRILDLGGAVDHHPEGSLLAMGYRHKPKEVFIVDLPDDERLHQKTVAGLRDLTTEQGTQVRYIYSDMTDLKDFAANSFDLVWSGQSIEHITEIKADVLIQEVFRVLKPGGSFCLDTPNDSLMRLHSKEYIHPEHKIEYKPEQLAAKLRRGGFELEEIKAVTPCPISLRVGRLSKLEIIKETRVGEDAEAGFSFFIQCRKPLGG